MLQFMYFACNFFFAKANDLIYCFVKKMLESDVLIFFLLFVTAIAVILGILFLVLGILIVLFFQKLVDAFIAGVSETTFLFLPLDDLKKG